MAFDYSVKFEAIDKISNVVDKINGKMSALKSKAKDAVINLNVIHQQAMNRLNQVHNKMKDLSKKPIDISLSFASLASNVALLGMPIKKAIEIESAFAGITKVVDGTNEQMSKLKADLIDMTSVLPKTAVELMQIAEAGGKLGVPVDKIKEYVDVVAKASTAFEMPAEVAGEAFGKIGAMLGYEITQLRQYGDIVNALADSTSADAKNIIDITKRTAGVMGTLKFDVGTIAGLSAFADQMSVSSEVGATALNDVLNGIRGTEQGLKILQQKGGYGLIEVANKFKKLEGVARTKAIEDLFGRGEGSRMFEKLINQTDVLKASLDSALSEKTLGSMQREFENVSNTTANKIRLMANGVERLAIKIGDALLPNINELITYLAPIIDKVSIWAGENKDLIITMAKILAVGIALTAGFLMIQASLAPILIAIRVYTAIVAIATGVVNLFNVALWANPITWVVVGIIALIAIVAVLIYYWKDLTTWINTLWNDFLGFIAPIANVGTAIEEMQNKFINFVSSFNLIDSAINGIKSAFEILVAPIKYVIDLIDMFLSKFEINKQTKQKVQELAGAVETQVSNSWENTKQFLGFSDNTNTDTQKSNDVQIDNTNKNHTIVDVNIKSDAGVVTEQNAQSTGGRVKLNTASNGV
jgi:TP901 family phage tail tape measure protein